MNRIEMLLDYFLGPLVLVTLLTVGLIGINLFMAQLQKGHPERVIHRQVTMLITTLLAVFLLIIFLPISESLRGQILSLLGILLSAAIALSATTFLGNALAGILLRSVRSFRTGDFIYIQDQFGRVSGRGLFHIEIQTEDRDLVTLPNLYVTNNPVKVTRESGTIISAEVSLGYDVPHIRVEDLLVQAATKAGLQDPFVYILQLGDFSVLYKANGILTDVRQLLSARSLLNGTILDTLHQAGVEIVSPNFMNTRDVSERTFISQPVAQGGLPADNKEPEEIIFDKAEQATTLENQKSFLVKIKNRLEELEEELSQASEADKESLEKSIAKLQRQESLLQNKISDGEKDITENPD